MTSSVLGGIRVFPLRIKDFFITLLVLFTLSALLFAVNAQVPGADILYNTTETKSPAAADYLNTSGGSFTTIILSSETQNLKWKAYAGNVTGVLTLDDNGNYSIYQWALAEITGEVYSSRNSSITWSSIRCANSSNIINEEVKMNHTTRAKDSINSTFSLNIHKAFYVGLRNISQSTCPSTFTWANDTVQIPSVNAPYQEVLLHDTRNMVYTTFINDNVRGFNFNRYDFQMILPEKGVGGYSNTRYYFYMELQ